MDTALHLSSSSACSSKSSSSSSSISRHSVDCTAPQTPQSVSYCDLCRSTRGASKQRRDQINVEIQRMRDLLPLSESIKDRLFQLQVMSLGCIYIRKHRYQKHILRTICESAVPLPKGLDMCKALRGFLIMLNRSGKLLHVSENASEYLGHSIEEIMCQGDSIFDLVDSRDHSIVLTELSSDPQPTTSFPDERVFLCRLNLARTAKRQLQYHKVEFLIKCRAANADRCCAFIWKYISATFILLQGRYFQTVEPYQAVTNAAEVVVSFPNTAEPIFAAYCQPVINPENAETLSIGNTDVFSSQHFLDMSFKEADNMKRIHSVCQEKEGSVLALLKMRSIDGDWIWLHTVLAVRGNLSHEIQEGRRVRHVIHCYYQVLSAVEAATLQANSWIYNVRHTYPAAFPCRDSPSPVTLFAQPFLTVSGTNDVPMAMDDFNCILPLSLKGTLPDLRDGLDDFFREVEQPVEDSTSISTSMMSSPTAPYSQEQANDLFKYLGPALFGETASHQKETLTSEMQWCRKRSWVA
ncbi:unnamed protein product [Nippostrongylus brasiliensis]|uniref:Neuronal PAS domain-containing protein 4 n=1 Tax=Nippostrongylus brasiliensis TaxID=27835 RepID=A0A158QXW9_NIPBR|nr:unnamed protein product [Nippostrongylus brasiliensis]